MLLYRIKNENGTKRGGKPVFISNTTTAISPRCHVTLSKPDLLVHVVFPMYIALHLSRKCFLWRFDIINLTSNLLYEKDKRIDVSSHDPYFPESTSK